MDIIGDAPAQRYSDALGILLDASEVDCVLVLNCPTAVASSADAARAVIETATQKKRPVLTSWLRHADGGGRAQPVQCSGVARL